MAIVNFAIPKNLEQRVNAVIKEKGFGSKAEFFRFAAIHFIDVMQKPQSEEARFAYLTSEVVKEVGKQYGKRTLPSAREQLADL